MSKYCLIVLAAVLFVQLSSARVIREAPPQDPQHIPTLTEISDKTQEILKQVNEEFLKFVGVRTNDELVEKVQTQTKTYVDSAKVQFDDLAKQVNNEKTQEFVNNIKKQLDDLTKENPAVTADAKVLNDKFQNSVQKIVKETQRFGTKLQTEGGHLGEDIEKLLKTIITTTADRAKQITATTPQ